MEKCWIIKTIFSKIHIHFFFYVVALTCILCGYFYPFLLFMYLIVVHECGHIIAGIFCKWHIKKIVLLPFGGLTIFEDSMNKPMKEELVITIMGPLFQVIGYYLLKCKVDETLFFSFHYAILIFNLLPIPALDGCQVIFAIVEKIIGRELPEKVKVALQLCGLGLVMLLMIFVTYQDILRIFQ